LTNAQKPDIVLLGGDIGASKNLDDIMDIGIFAGKINLIDAPVYAVLGEYDWHAGGEEIAQELRRNGIRVLENSSYRI
jgi:predicted phosphodiesterase